MPLALCASDWRFPTASQPSRHFSQLIITGIVPVIQQTGRWVDSTPSEVSVFSLCSTVCADLFLHSRNPSSPSQHHHSHSSHDRQHPADRLPGSMQECKDTEGPAAAAEEPCKQNSTSSFQPPDGDPGDDTENQEHRDCLY